MAAILGISAFYHDSAAALVVDGDMAMNLKIKFRESFRPFAPVVLREQASDFNVPGGADRLHAAGGLSALPGHGHGRAGA